VDLDELKRSAATPWTKRILEGAKEYAAEMYKVAVNHGDKAWFHDFKGDIPSVQL
jgi:hypothetical protein